MTKQCEIKKNMLLSVSFCMKIQDLKSSKRYIKANEVRPEHLATEALLEYNNNIETLASDAKMQISSPVDTVSFLSDLTLKELHGRVGHIGTGVYWYNGSIGSFLETISL